MIRRATRRGQLPLLVIAFITTVGVHVQLADVTGSDVANRSQFVVADIFAILLVITTGGALIAGPLRRWIPFAAWLAFDALVWGQISRYALINKLAGIALLILACSAVALHLQRRGPAAIQAAVQLFISVAAIEAAIAVVALELAPRARMPFHIPLNFDATRVSGFMVDPNAFGGFAALALLLSFGTARATRRTTFHRLREVALVAAILLTYSRTVWVATVVGSAYLLITASSRTRVRATVLICCCGALYLMAKISLPVDKQLVERSFTIGQRTSGAETAYREWRTSPIVGIGVGKYVTRHQFIVHNTPLWVLTELGGFGLALLTYASVGVARSLRRCAASARWLYHGLVAGVGAVAVMGMGIEILYQRYVWLLFALVYSAATPTSAPPTVTRSSLTIGRHSP